MPPGAPGAIRLHGSVYDGRGEPVPDALLEIRQADATGRAPRVEGSLRRDGSVFTGWGRAATDPGGRYSFTTVEPGRVGDGAAFFAVTVFARGLLDRLFTRAYLPGPAAEADALLAGLDPARRRTLLRSSARTTAPCASTSTCRASSETVFLSFPGHRP